MNLENHINQIIDEYRYENRSVAHPNACICYEQGTPCHDMENLNCFFCYCPYYDTQIVEGGCLRNSPDGQWHQSEKLPTGRIWDCSNCEHPHLENTVKVHLEKTFQIKRQK